MRRIVTIRHDGYNYRVPGPNGTEDEAHYTDDREDAWYMAIAMHGAVKVKFHNVDSLGDDY